MRPDAVPEGPEDIPEDVMGDLNEAVGVLTRLVRTGLTIEAAEQMFRSMVDPSKVDAVSDEYRS